MKNLNSYKRYTVTALGSMVGCFAAALSMGLYPAAATVMGILAILSVIVFSLCCSRWLEVSFAAQTGIALSEYCPKFYGGYWGEENQRAWKTETR